MKLKRINIFLCLFNIIPKAPIQWEYLLLFNSITNNKPMFTNRHRNPKTEPQKDLCSNNGAAWAKPDTPRNNNTNRNRDRNHYFKRTNIFSLFEFNCRNNTQKRRLTQVERPIRTRGSWNQTDHALCCLSPKSQILVKTTSGDLSL